MGNVGTAANGKTLIGSGVGASPTFAPIGTLSGLTAHGVVVSENAGAFVATNAATNGQLLIGATNADPAFASLTSSGGTITITPGAHTLNIEAVSAVLTVNIQTFSTSGSHTYTPTTGMSWCIVEIVGGGGGSGGVAITGDSTIGSGGGGGGGYSKGHFSAATIGSSQTVVIGAGGTAGSDSVNGGTGGTSTFGSTGMSSTGGHGGVSITAPASSTASSGGAGGVGSGGDVNITGSPGGNGFAFAFVVAGNGGCTYFGGGGLTTSILSPTGGQVVGMAGTSSGGGASGAANGNDQSAAAGAAGAAGICVIIEYIIT